jgi:mRNA-degrading endonuclease RelE of RelBE toxin-antitoxin system
MSFNIIATEPFSRKLKKLAKKYRSLKEDLLPLLNELETNPTLGVPLGKDCFKIRLSISSKGKGKSGGARIITYVRVINKSVFLIDIFDKSEQSNITEKELIMLIEILAE